ncbi:PAAR domain-containing protein [Methylovirgula sp. 4M-Z18]|uniref:PAAR domain-containing protein n=1 Tax=Methylovirgula sp. 4M-Z18 TaxID=2293567 RepID=UPI001FDF5EA0|nr:PAAR domain-containing protein [Methylovirgula sp. 4M-Z18]
MHICPQVTVLVPHVGGPIVMGSPNVITGGQPQARITDLCVCVGPPDMIALGSATVLVNSLMAARIGDLTVHGGTIIGMCPTVLIGG